jgi:hypothetical protein
MEMPRLNKSVKRVVKLERDQDGTMVPTLIYKSDSGRRKVSSAMRPLEKGVRKVVRAQSKLVDTYLERHDRSNRKKKDGWLKDVVSNVSRSAKKSQKTLSKNNLRWPKAIQLG